MYMGEKEEEEKVTTRRSHQKVSKSTISDEGKVERRQEKKVHLQKLAKANLLYNASYQN